MEGPAVDAGAAGAMCMPLYETLVTAFPQGLMPEGLEHSIRGKVRKRLRDIGYRVVFPPGESWQTVLEHFAIAGIERIHRGFGDNPWFWVVAWPSVFGAAAVDFWPEVGTPEERRALAADASASHLEAILITRALQDSEAIGALPNPAVKGLRAMGQSALPALPTVSVNEKALLIKSDPLKPSGGIAAPPITPHAAAAPTAFSPDAGNDAGQGEAGAAPAGPTGTSTSVRKQPDVPSISSWQVRTPLPAGALKLLRPPLQPPTETPAAGGVDSAEAEPATAFAPAADGAGGVGAPSPTPMPDPWLGKNLGAPSPPGSPAPRAPAADVPGGGVLPAPCPPPDPWLGKQLGAPSPPDPWLGKQLGVPSTPDPWWGKRAGVPGPPSGPSTAEKDLPGSSYVGAPAAPGAAPTAPPPQQTEAVPPPPRAAPATAQPVPQPAAPGAAASAGSPEPQPLARHDGEPCECGSVAVRVEAASEVYGEQTCAMCDQCFGPCGVDGLDEARKAPFMHCASCNRDRCAQCAGI